MTPRQALRRSPLPFVLAIVIALGVCMAALAIWHGSDTTPQDGGPAGADQAQAPVRAATTEAN